MGAASGIVAKAERVTAQPIVGHPKHFMQQFALGMVGLIALKKFKSLPPEITGSLKLIKILENAPQHKRTKSLALYAATGCTQFDGLTRLRCHFLIAPLGKEKIGVDRQQLGEQLLPQQRSRSLLLG